MVAFSEWSMLRNTFDNVTKNNYKRAVLMGSDHDDKLGGEALLNPDIMPIYLQFHNAFNVFERSYQAVNSNFGLYQGHTMQVEATFGELMSTLARKWDVMVQIEYDQNSPEYKMLLPDGRKPFQSGAYDLRINAVGSFLSNIQNSSNPNFTNLKTSISNWLLNTQTLRTKQQQTESRDKTMRQDLEVARQNMTNMMHIAFFKLAAYYGNLNNLVKVESFYELRYLRTSPTKNTTTPATTQTNTLTLLPNEQKVLLKGSFNENDIFELKNMGNGVLMAWLANSDTAPIPADAFSLAAGETGNPDGIELGDGSNTFTHLLIKNIEQGMSGKIEVTLLVP
jgi:hypothetical protein